MDINDILAVMNNQKAYDLSTSKGGYEGWLQAELWHHLSQIPNADVEREFPYPESDFRCDLVDRGQWVELKAFGKFRAGDENAFLDGIARDVWKLFELPADVPAWVYVVVPIDVGDRLLEKLKERRWLGFNIHHAEFISVLYMDATNHSIQNIKP
ncbi:hypothetical protein ACT048_04865 [Ectopseudomonas khazarica]|uniref:hypothetical protein n=1 Tax=Ectopseudomonas khazarica TaxID=2502979 RepID=UPI004034081E